MEIYYGIWSGLREATSLKPGHKRVTKGTRCQYQHGE